MALEGEIAGTREHYERATAAAVERTPGRCVDDVLNELRTVIDAAHDRTDRLGMRIEPIMRPPSPQPPSSVDVDGVNSDLGNRLQSILVEAQRLYRRLDDLGDRVDLS